jgi:hypothetical protein
VNKLALFLVKELVLVFDKAKGNLLIQSIFLSCYSVQALPMHAAYTPMYESLEKMQRRHS